MLMIRNTLGSTCWYSGIYLAAHVNDREFIR